MTRKSTALLTLAAVLGGLTAATMVFAQNTTSPSRPPAPQGMMGDQGGIMGMMGQMNPDQMKQMTRMVENCNRMMESMSKPSTGPDKAGTHG